MSLNPLAPAFLPLYQFSTNPPLLLYNSTTMILPLAQLFCGTLPPLIPSQALSNNQPIIDGTFILPHIRPTNHSKQDAAPHQSHLGSSSLLSSSVQHQANCLQATHKTNQQFHQHLDAEQLDRMTLQIFVLQFQNDFAILCYFFSPRLEQIPSVILPLKTPLPVHQLTLTLSLTLTLTLRQMHSCFLALLNILFVVLPRRALWYHPERTQSTLPTLTFSLQPPHGMAH